MKVEVPNPPLDRIVFNDPKEKIYVGTTIKYPVSVFDIANLERDDIDLNYSSSNTSLADFDDYGNLTVSKPGNLTITVTADEGRDALALFQLQPAHRHRQRLDMLAPDITLGSFGDGNGEVWLEVLVGEAEPELVDGLNFGVVFLEQAVV